MWFIFVGRGPAPQTSLKEGLDHMHYDLDPSDWAAFIRSAGLADHPEQAHKVYYGHFSDEAYFELSDEGYNLIRLP